MKAYTCEKYGPPEVLQLKEVEKPVPKNNEVLIKIHATTVNAADCNVRGLSYIPTGLGFVAKMMLGLKKPKISIIGSVLAGEVEAVGNEVTSFKVGDQIYGTGPELGAYAEYACRLEKGALALKPKDTKLLHQLANTWTLEPVHGDGMQIYEIKPGPTPDVPHDTPPDEPKG